MRRKRGADPQISKPVFFRSQGNRDGGEFLHSRHRTGAIIRVDLGVDDL